MSDDIAPEILQTIDVLEALETLIGNAPNSRIEAIYFAASLD
jgi:hypothetical protein